MAEVKDFFNWKKNSKDWLYGLIVKIMGQEKDMGIREKLMENKAINKVTQRHKGRELGAFLILLRTGQPSTAKPRLEETCLKWG